MVKASVTNISVSYVDNERHLTGRTELQYIHNCGSKVKNQFLRQHAQETDKKTYRIARIRIFATC